LTGSSTVTSAFHFVADGAIHCNVITRFDTRLLDSPITVVIKDGVVQDFHVRNRTVKDLLDSCFSRKNGRRVGELRFGTNRCVTSFVRSNSHVNERFPGLHLGFGQHSQPPDLVEYEEEVHLDLISQGSEIHFDDGSDCLSLASFPSLDIPHPSVREDDITGDCCSFGYGMLRLSEETFNFAVR
jgi:hypothetical protein